MYHSVKTFADNPAVASAIAEELVSLIADIGKSQRDVNIALSGGSTPKLLFEILAERFADQINWAQVHFFWGDERCVEPDSSESNFGEAHRLLLTKVAIPEANVHRVLGESDPNGERQRYEQEIEKQVPANDAGVPEFDIVLLGMGSDGHTASIFPHEIELLQSQNVCEVATHPESGQKRITITGKVIDAGRNVYFLITGEGKASVLAEIFGEKPGFEKYPTSHVKPARPATFYLDEAAASQLAK